MGNVKERQELCLTGLKGIGVCIIAFFWHYNHFMTPGSPPPMYKSFALLYTHGGYAVELFFMLSGFGMMAGYGHKIVNREISFPYYFAKRIGKIYPLFLLTLILTAGLELIYKLKAGTTFVYPNLDAYHFLLNLFCIQDGFLGVDWSFNAPSWYLSIAFICYAIFYYLAYKGNIYYHMSAVLLLGMWVLSGNVYYPTLINSLVARGLVCFSIGALLYGIYEKQPLFNSLTLGYISLGIATTLVITWYAAGEDAVGNIQWAFILGVWPGIIFAALFIPQLNKLFQIKPLLFLGTLSFDIYLIHFPIQCLIHTLNIYCDLGLKYPSKRVWIIYVVTVLVVSLFYKQFVDASYRRAIKRFCGFHKT